jgi:hypothetical protein
MKAGTASKSMAQGAAARSRPTANAITSADYLRISLTKSEMCAIHSSWRNPFPLARRRAANEKPRLFETWAHNLPREPGRGSDFLTYIACNPLKRLDSEK